jgi:hypothetical protein
VLADVRRSVLMKAEEVGALREQTLTGGHETLLAAAAALRAAFEGGGRLLALGNGARRPTRWTPWPTSARRCGAARRTRRSTSARTRRS